MLGMPRVVVDGRTVGVTWARRSLSLLSYLLTARGPVPRDGVAFALWPDDDEEDARGNLRRNLNVLRGALPAGVVRWILVDAGSIGFDHDQARTDVGAFESLLTDPANYVAALNIYGGDFAAPLYDVWAVVERERLRAELHRVLLHLVNNSFSARRFDEALVYARRIVADEPLREDVLRRVIAIRYAMGDRPGALAEFERFRRALRRELDVEPMPETCALHALVLRGEPLPFAPDVGARPVTIVEASARLLPFGGRQPALAALRAAWDTASTSGGRTVFVSGEAGVGKTRIVAELLAGTVGSSARILRGTTGSPEARPFEAILGALAQALPYLPSLTIEPVWLNILAGLFPNLGAHALDAPPVALPPEREALRILEAFTRILIALSRARPVVAVFEDLHWAGPATLAAVRHISSRISGQRILLLVTHRDGEGPAVEALRRDLCACGQASSVALARLSDADAASVLAQLAAPPAPAEARLLVARSEGNPLFLTELLRESPQSLRAMTSGIAELVTARLGRSSANGQTLARVAAICGATFDFDLLRAVVGWPDGTLIDAIAELLRRQFIRATAMHERGSYAFSHALVRDAIAALAPADEQRRVHHIVARALESRAPGLSYVEIALHWAAAHEPERAARAYANAAKDSLRAQARDEAAALATAGEALTADPRLRFELVRTRIEANLRRAPTTALRHDALLLRALAEALDEAARYSAALLAFRIEDVGGDGATRARSAAVLQGLSTAGCEPRRSAEVAEVEATIAMSRGDTVIALAAAQRARDEYHAAGANSDELRAGILIARMHGRIGNADTAFALLATLEGRVTTLANATLSMDYWNARAAAAHARYDAVALLRASEQCGSAARAAGDRLMEGHAAWSAGTAHALAGRLTQAFTETKRAAEIYASIGAASHLREIGNNHASMLLQVGRIAEATAILEANLTYARTAGLLEFEYFSASNLGVAYLAAGAAPAALELQRHAFELAAALGSAAFTALALGDLGACEVTLGAFASGVAHLLEAAAMHRTLNRMATRAHDLARAAAAEPALGAAGGYAREALAIVEADPEAVKHAPEILWCCALVFERGGDPAAAAYARRLGRDILKRRAAAIENAEDRRYFCSLPHHATLLEELAAVR